MIKFFRRIRQQLLAEGKFSNYLLYAVGEIILVVIGILIALQINDYSEVQKERKKEMILLSNLSKEVELDILQIENNTKISMERLGRLDSLVGLLSAPNSIDKSSFVLQSFEFVMDQYFKSNSGIFDEAVSSGKMSYVQNDSLRQKIFNYYRNAKETYTDGTTRQITDEFITPLLVENIYLNLEGFSMLGINLDKISNLRALDLGQLSQNRDFWKMVLLKFGGNREQILRWEAIKKRAEGLKNQIDQELEKLHTY
ncbi:DUF6090 family protein [Flagellimonas allohymeniacidonis]|uniref:Uncharacterized protein n=1 Tax=Flagellimonas allohymeniacidonis TaxID=2517819 RepID=A0A4Q8QCY4_9FLAO|nr:DUF6090 family protein [Allomuricauda hymeniacidonis]TAI47357.1 hypothetical protein EW142_11810 [Allomuricauda hymeniacidonis]